MFFGFFNHPVGARAIRSGSRQVRAANGHRLRSGKGRLRPGDVRSRRFNHHRLPRLI